jgi:hypothetical protein
LHLLHRLFTHISQTLVSVQHASFNGQDTRSSIFYLPHADRRYAMRQQSSRRYHEPQHDQVRG